MKKKIVIILLIFLIIGFLFRFIQIDKVPPGFDWDERSHAYNALSIAQTGKDEWGKSFPSNFRAFGDNKLPLYTYFTAFFVKIFGMNIVSSKLTAIFSGVLSILVIYFIFKELFNNKKWALLAAFFMVFSPHSLFFSRIALEPILANLLIIIGFLFAIKFLKKKSLVHFFLATIFLIASLFTYHLTRIIAPILLFFLFIFAFLNFKKASRHIIFYIAMLFITSIFIFSQYGSESVLKFKTAGLFGQNKGAVMEIDEFRGHDKNNLVSRILHNKATFFSFALIGNYVSHFSFDYLLNFRETNSVQQSYFPPIFVVMMPFYYFGLMFLVKDLFLKKEFEKKLITLFFLIWILASPIPSTITETAPDSRRALGSLGTWEILTTYGLFIVFLKIKKDGLKKLFFIIFTVLYLISLILFLNNFFHVYPSRYDYVYAFKENKIAELIKNNYSKYDIFIYSRIAANQPQIFALTALNYSPEKYIKEKKWIEKDKWFVINGFDKFLFYDEITPMVLSSKIFKGKKIALFLTRDEYLKNIEFVKNNVLFQDAYPSKASYDTGEPKEILYFIVIKL
ncbi:hypothetical protein CO165_01360 [Candidatus Roizmanbacteria bacterium CG_4_9_14_3_um_filter_33_18]|uniref:Glycosyltransferase RgtA/B/C/D-like domain-containing protein n=3 Tax=Candidatus Roizmaniibacteriota TaxID=1752723 RepID=A0A2M7XYP2_9BACT|nr:MAG: hypothetical protein COW97_02820 [Candidatus Roizmanbacteria bacterium CG22_combo_CG10-13_8_21_14_all_34_12]PIU36927.1 MAG: hypothetical protein COT02_03490 [Candidatus Roizmanbacteria bacterium CG07_land_8_20_14_0_80_34_15]PJA55855.1 MAG: hypothetical protein CO165_01360 [Candidatus Roizmanbacteria bacterium CG_4_9_14_3_um_filter_33_18]